MIDFVQRMRALRLGGRYQLVRLLGEGSFGKVYLGRDADTETEVAIKLEHSNVVPSFLEQEVEICQRLQSRPGFPLFFCHDWQNTFQVMVYELLGPNLEDLFCYCDQKFSLKTTLMLADQLLRRFESLHAIDYLHRDVKPENFLLGTGVHGNTVYMTDFGLAIYHRSAPLSSPSPKPVSRQHEIQESRLIGTCRYASINAHQGISQSRSDDLEALGYMLVYFMTGSLPWQGLKTTTQSEKYQRVLEMKQTIATEDLCHGLPPQFTTYMTYIRSLAETAVPDYRFLRGLFQRLFHKQGFQHDYVYDWTVREFQRQAVTS